MTDVPKSLCDNCRHEPPAVNIPGLHGIVYHFCLTCAEGERERLRARMAVLIREIKKLKQATPDYAKIWKEPQTS